MTLSFEPIAPAYHSLHTRPTGLRPPARGAADLLEAIGDRELPDAVITRARREELKELACALRARLSSHEIMYLAGTLEVEANGKRAEEEVRRP
jgi:hypothetical protein